jgi:hypothetical protein
MRKTSEKLIAAAPEMLEFMRELRHLVRKDLVEVPAIMVMMLNRIIGKAETGEPQKISAQPDIDICSDCKEHCEFDEDTGESNCCGVGPYCSDYETNSER